MTPEEMFNGGTMSVEKEVPKSEDSYQFSTGSVDDYMSLVEEVTKPKQEYENVEILPEEEMPTPKHNSKVIATNTAKFITNSIDRVMNITLSSIAGDDGETDFSADDDEKAEMQEYWEAVFPDPTKQMPPWVAAIASVLLIYGLKMKEAVAIRKARKKIEEDAIIIQRQEEENDRLRRELESIKNKTNE